MDTAPAINSRDRLAAVRSTGLLDTPADLAFDRLAALAANLLDAPFAFVTLVDDTRSFWKACIGVEASDPAERQNPVEESFCQYVVASREPLVLGDAAADELTKDNPSIEKMGVRAWAGFPVFTPTGEVLGSFCVVDTRTREWTDRDVNVLSTLSQAVSSEFALHMALEAAQQAGREAVALVATLQASLLPPVPPSVPGLDVAARYRPAGKGQEVVGDFYDVFRLGASGAWAVTIGDVSGKGVEAAKVTALARHTIRAAAMLGGSPAEVLSALNSALLAQALPNGLDEPRFLTATYAQIEIISSTVVVTLASAGHCLTLVRRTSGAAEPVEPAERIEAIGLPGLPLGWFTDPGLGEEQFLLSPGDSLVLYTDGIVEARRGLEMFGEERVMTSLAAMPDSASAAELAEQIDAAVLEYAGDELADDAAILVVSVPGVSV